MRNIKFPPDMLESLLEKTNATRPDWAQLEAERDIRYQVVLLRGINSWTHVQQSYKHVNDPEAAFGIAVMLWEEIHDARPITF